MYFKDTFIGIQRYLCRRSTILVADDVIINHIHMLLTINIYGCAQQQYAVFQANRYNITPTGCLLHSIIIILLADDIHANITINSLPVIVDHA